MCFFNCCSSQNLVFKMYSSFHNKTKESRLSGQEGRNRRCRQVKVYAHTFMQTSLCLHDWNDDWCVDKILQRKKTYHLANYASNRILVSYASRLLDQQKNLMTATKIYTLLFNSCIESKNKTWLGQFHKMLTKIVTLNILFKISFDSQSSCWAFFLTRL